MWEKGQRRGLSCRNQKVLKAGIRTPSRGFKEYTNQRKKTVQHHPRTNSENGKGGALTVLVFPSGMGGWLLPDDPAKKKENR